MREKLEQLRHQQQDAERSLRHEQGRDSKYGRSRRRRRNSLPRSTSSQRRRRRTPVARGSHEDEIAQIVSRWTHPGHALVEGEREKLLKLDEILHPA